MTHGKRLVAGVRVGIGNIPSPMFGGFPFLDKHALANGTFRHSKRHSVNTVGYDAPRPH